MSGAEEGRAERRPRASDAQVHVGEMRCPFCHEAIARGVEPISCPTCHAAHHEGCLREHGRCAACSAEHPRYPAAVLPPREATGAARPGAAPREAGRAIRGLLYAVAFAAPVTAMLIQAAVGSAATPFGAARRLELACLGAAAGLTLLVEWLRGRRAQDGDRFLVRGPPTPGALASVRLMGTFLALLGGGQALLVGLRGLPLIDPLLPWLLLGAGLVLLAVGWHRARRIEEGA